MLMETLHPLTAISPIDGRYHRNTQAFGDYFSEYALIKYRVYIEVSYFIALCELPLPQLAGVDKALFPRLRAIYEDFSLQDAQEVKDTEKVTNHDVKSVEYFVKNRLEALGLGEYTEFVHFGLTSQDINNTSVPLSVKHAVQEVYLPKLREIVDNLSAKARAWKEVSMLARTHGQPASPTVLGKEVQVFVVRLQEQLAELERAVYAGKFGGATGNFNAHYVAYPQIDWQGFANRFLQDSLGLKRSFPTTQIEHYDHLAALFQGLSRVNTILIDLCRDCWTYISMEYFKQAVKAQEVGSSAMPHKVNPIDFENAEGNLGIANALFNHLAGKLPISRLQRDLTDSTVLRNVGVPLAHSYLAMTSLLKGLNKLLLNPEAIARDLDHNWAVLAEAIQTILRREGYPKPYEALKALTRGNAHVTRETLHAFIEQLDVNQEVKDQMRALTPANYVGCAY